VIRRTNAIAATLLTVLVLSYLAGDAATPASTQLALPNVQQLGPQVGSRVPDFTLTDQRGQPRTLASLMGRNGLMLVFFRSADW
jgi:cytochrome oxidase Cu insertion factor (SCO1/SenC/PrrC family)